MVKWIKDHITSQKGMAHTITLALMIVLVISAFVGYGVYHKIQKKSNSSVGQQKQAKQVTYTGTITLNPCPNTDCVKQNLRTTDNKNYTLTGQNASPFNGKVMRVTGLVSGTEPNQTIAVTKIEPTITPPQDCVNNSGGVTCGKTMLKGQVYCTQKFSRSPCATKIEIETVYVGDARAGVSSPSISMDTDANGKFSVDLEPGQYNVMPATKVGYPIFLPALTNPVTLTSSKVTEITISYHDGTK